MLERLFGRRKGSHDEKADPARLAALGAAVRARLSSDSRAEELGGKKAELFELRDFASEAECVRLIEAIDVNAVPSPTYKGGSGRSDARTSSTHYFGDDAVALALAERIDAFLGIPRTHAEPLQGQRYREGEQFRNHADYFREDREYWQRERLRGGQRTWTAMLYLNDVEAGGGTSFPGLDLSVKPEAGKLVVWNNMDRKGRPNAALVHAGLPVEAGTKYVVTQWYRLEPWSLSVGS